MSLRSMVLNRPLLARSSLTSCATSNEAAAICADAKGTTASGMASVWPFVTSTTNSAWARQGHIKLAARRATHTSCLFMIDSIRRDESELQDFAQTMPDPAAAAMAMHDTLHSRSTGAPPHRRCTGSLSHLSPRRPESV